MRAVVLNSSGQPELAELSEPEGSEILRVLACGLCGSDVEKIGRAAEGTVLGHEVVAEADGKRVALIHHRPCGECERCRAGHESTCEEFAAATIQPGGFAERVAALGGWVDLPDEVDDALGSYAEPLACVLRGAERVPPGEVLVLGGGFVGRLFAAVLTRRGETVYVRDAHPARNGPEPSRAVRAVVVCAPGAGADALAAAEPGGTVLVFADAGVLDAAEVYRREITVTGSRSATRRHMEEAVTLLPELDLPEPLVLPLDRFDEGLAAYRNREALKVVFRP
ncbi:MAG TPA: alcohol dehydrogenase catalytic domain-containing protein [Gaiellaceae bacterium]|nr:alcohol dehydrogenase catalytic domain-containing protein [Gaiellaceae bacterium]